MQWIEAVVHTTTAGSDLVSDVLMRCGALGTQVLDKQDIADVSHPDAWELMDQDLLGEMPADVLVKGWFLQEESARLNSLDKQFEELKNQSKPASLGSLSVEIATVADDDWAEGWKRYYKPFRIGKRMIVKPTWEPYEAEADDLVVEMDPGMAFGTGTHETTNMCMILMEKYLQPGMDVMDIGTGSGILAIAAARLGAQKVLGVDIDPDAVKVARENIRRNDVQDSTDAVHGDMVRGEAIPCDLVVTNIVAGAICVLCEPIKKYLKIGGVFVCSGIIKEREQDVLDSFAENGYEILERITQGEWVAFSVRRQQ